MGRQLDVKREDVAWIYEYISRIIHLHVDILFQDLVRCWLLVKSVSVSKAADGLGMWMPACRRAVSNTKSSDCCTANNADKNKYMHFIMFILMLGVCCYCNIKCEISVWNRTESRKHRNRRTIYVYMGVLNVGMKLSVLIEMRHKTWNLKYVNRYFFTF